VQGKGLAMQDLGSGRLWLAEGVDDDDYVDDMVDGEGSFGANPSHWRQEEEEEEEDYDDEELGAEPGAGHRGWGNGHMRFSQIPQPQRQPQEQQQHHQAQRRQNLDAPDYHAAPVAAPAAAASSGVRAASSRESEKQELMRQARASQRTLLRPPAQSL